MVSASLSGKTKLRVAPDAELATKNQPSATRLPQAEENLNIKIEAWQGLARTVGPVYPVQGIVNDRCTCEDPNCSRPGKHPWTHHGYKDATTDPVQIEKWVRGKPNCNVGIATGGEIAVLDIDGLAGEEALRVLQEQYSPLPETWEVLTGREGGRHLYFTKPPRIAMRSRSIAPGLDIKAEGGGVVGPGSLHISGRRYRVKNPNVKMQELPEDLVELLSSPPNKESDVASTSLEGKIRETQRNNTVFALAINIWKFLGDKEFVLAAAQMFNKIKCEPPLPAAEVDRTVESACKNRGASMGLPEIPTTFTASEVLAMELPPTKWLAEEIIPPGVGILGGKPKFGKSWLVLNLAVNVARCTPLFGRFPVAQGSVLYLALEDNHWRLQERLTEMGVSGDEPFMSKIHFAIWWPRFDEDHHGLEYVEKHIDDIGDCVLVVIDLLENVRPGKKGNKSDYELAYQDLNAIKRIAQNRDITILMLHHTNKTQSDNPLDSILGTTGLTGGTDFTMILQRDGDGRSPNGTLIVRGRDLRADIKARLTLMDGWWKWLGTVDQVRKNDNDNRVLAVLTSEPQSFTGIEKESQLKKGTCSGVLSRLVRDGLAIRERNGKYRLAPDPWDERQQDEYPF
jgi:hypothetical protein